MLTIKLKSISNHEYDDINIKYLYFIFNFSQKCLIKIFNKL